MSSYWEIGKLLEEKKIDSQYGDSIVKRLSHDLKSKYPHMGLSPRNLWDMKKFYLRYNEEDTKVRQAVALLPWSHNLLLLSYDFCVRIERALPKRAPQIAHYHNQEMIAEKA